MTDARYVVVYNTTYESLSLVNLKKALRLLWLGKAVIHEADENKGTVGNDWPYPKSVRLVKFAKVNHKSIYGDALFSKHNVLKRDHYRCCYCGKTAKTIDHVHPRSRGGANDYSNTVAACFSCNNKKDNRTPKEAGMAMLFQPYQPTKAELISR